MRSKSHSSQSSSIHIPQLDTHTETGNGGDRLSHLAADNPLSGLLYVGRQAKEAGAVCVWERGDEGEVVLALVGGRQGDERESLDTTLHWRHHLGEEGRGREHAVCTCTCKVSGCTAQPVLYSPAYSSSLFLSVYTFPATTESLKYCSR